MDSSVALDFTVPGGGAEQLDSVKLFDTSPLQNMLKQIIAQVALHDEMLRGMSQKQQHEREDGIVGIDDKQEKGEGVETDIDRDELLQDLVKRLENVEKTADEAKNGMDKLMNKLNVDESDQQSIGQVDTGGTGGDDDGGGESAQIDSQSDGVKDPVEGDSDLVQRVQKLEQQVAILMEQRPDDREKNTDSSDDADDELFGLQAKIASLEKLVQDIASTLDDTKDSVIDHNDRIATLESKLSGVGSRPSTSSSKLQISAGPSSPTSPVVPIIGSDSASDSLEDESQSAGPLSMHSHSHTTFDHGGDPSDLSILLNRLNRHEKELEELRKLISLSPRTKVRAQSVPSGGVDIVSSHTTESIPPRFSLRGADASTDTQESTSSPIMAAENDKEAGEKDGENATDREDGGAQISDSQQDDAEQTPSSDVPVAQYPPSHPSHANNFEGDFVLYVDSMFDDIASRIMAIEKRIQDMQNNISSWNNMDKGGERFPTPTSPTPPTDNERGSHREGRAPRPIHRAGSQQGIQEGDPSNSLTGIHTDPADDMRPNSDERSHDTDTKPPRTVKQLDREVNNILDAIAEQKQDIGKINLDDYVTYSQLRDLEDMLAKKADRKDLQELANRSPPQAAFSDFDSAFTADLGLFSMKDKDETSNGQDINADGATLDSHEIKEIKDALNAHAKHLQMLHKTKADKDMMLKYLDENAERLDKLEQVKADARIVARKADREYLDNALDRIRREIAKAAGPESSGAEIEELARDVEYLKNLLHGKANRQDLSDIRDMIDEVRRSAEEKTGEGLAGHKGFRCLSCNRMMPSMRERPSKMNFDSFISRLPRTRDRLHTRYMIPNDPYTTNIPQDILKGMTKSSDGRSPHRRQQRRQQQQQQDHDGGTANGGTQYQDVDQYHSGLEHDNMNSTSGEVHIATVDDGDQSNHPDSTEKTHIRVKTPTLPKIK